MRGEKMLRYIKADFLRLMYHGRFIWAVLIVVIMCCMSSYEQIYALQYGGKTCLLELFDELTVYESFRLLSLLPACFLGTCLACEDSLGMQKYICVRGNQKIYIIARIAVCAVSSLLVIVTGFLIYAWLASGIINILGCDMENYGLTAPYASVAIFHGEIAYIMVLAILNGMMAMLFSMSALCTTILTQEKRVILIVPLIGFYFVSQFSAHLPDKYNIYLICANFDIIHKSASQTFIHSCLFLGSIALILAIIYYFLYFNVYRKDLR